jgi:hypothetical protein
VGRTEHINIFVAALVGLVGVGTVEALTLLGVQEWIKFAVAAVTFAAISLGAYWFVLAQGDRRGDRGRAGAPGRFRERPFHALR